MLPGFEHLAVTANSPSKKSRFFQLLLLVVLIILISFGTGCGVSSSTETATSAAHIAVTIPSPTAQVGVSYSSVATVSGGVAPYIFSLSSGTLPPGTTLNSHSGAITGVPTAEGNYTFVVSVRGSSNSEHGSGGGRINVEAGRANSSKQSHIAISPSSSTVASLGTEQFTASVTGTSDTAVTWTVSAGTISSAGKFTAPAVKSDTTVTVTATGATGKSLEASATVNVTPIPALTIDTNTLSTANVGAKYSDSLSATGGVSPYSWSMSSGALPAGIQLAANGTIAGTTASSGNFPFTVKVTDNTGSSTTHSYTLAVASSSSTTTTSTTTSGNFDGPAELPRILISSTMADTPAPGTTTTVNSGGNLQSALNSANCGDTIQLQAGATFAGAFTFPAKSCDDNHWIIVRTSANDSTLPAEGSRLTPCYAGVSSLPGRPALNCASTQNVLAKLVLPQSGNGPIVFASGANHYRLMGLEITRTTGTGLVYALASITNGGTANNLILDRVWMHGTAQDDTNRGFLLSGGTYVSVIDSSLTDFHCVSKTGACTDSQTIAGGLGSGPMGPYKVSDNFLEASGENILLGGGAATATPADIEITRNHFFKPLTWLSGQPGFVGGTDGNPFLVKNLLELKNAQRVLVDGNVMEDSWGGFSQVGFAIVITPKNQEATNGTNVCPICQVTDVIVRNTTISHVGAGLQIANALAGTGVPLDGERYSIHDIVVDDIDGPKFDGPSELAQISTSAGAPILQDVTINHVTAFPSSHLLIVGAVTTPMKNFVFTNSIVNAGTYPVWSSGEDGSDNCAYADSPLTTLNACFTPYTFSSNVIIGSPASTVWVPSNLLAASATTVQFVNYNGGNGGDYHLLSTSPYSGKGTDGKDLGADIDAVTTAIANVQ